MNESVKAALQVHRRESSILDGSLANDDLLGALLVEHEEPDRPIHPALEYEVFAQVSERGSDEDSSSDDLSSVDDVVRNSRENRLQTNFKLVVSFFFLVIAGAGNVLAAKLQAIPMYNYPNFINIFANFMYIPICFAYIIPVSRKSDSTITADQINMSRQPFIIMGALDCLATTMQIFASVYLPGPLLVLLPQAAIPCSMLLSRYLLQERYNWTQYAGAAIVLLGILVVLEPVVSHRRAPDFYCEALDVYKDCTVCQKEMTQEGCLSHWADDSSSLTGLWSAASLRHNDTNPSDASSLCQWLPYEEAAREEEFLTVVWSLVMLASTVPMTLSTIYKEVALGTGIEVDPIYLNGWISVFQFIFSLFVAIPAGWFASPSIVPSELPRNLWDGLLCFGGHGTIDSGCHPDSLCSFHAAFFVSLALVCNMVYTFFMMFVLKYGSSALLFLALTVMVPLGHVAFSLPIMPQSTPLNVSDLLGLGVIMTGLICFRFLHDPAAEQQQEQPPLPNGTTPWFQDWMQQLREPNSERIVQELSLQEPLLAQEEGKEEERGEPTTVVEQGDV